MLTQTPTIGQVLVYRNTRLRTQLPVRVVKASPAVCEVEILAGGVDNSLKGQIIRAHVALLHVK